METMGKILLDSVITNTVLSQIELYSELSCMNTAIFEQIELYCELSCMNSAIFPKLSYIAN